jgi:hypothetical protein
MSRTAFQWFKTLSVGILISLSLFTTSATVAAAAGGDQWSFQLTPYAWLAGQNGKVASFPGYPAVDLDVDFYDDILGNINGAFMLVGEARKGRLGVAADIVYTDIEFEEKAYKLLFYKLTSKTENWIVSAAGFYRLVEKGRAFFDGVAGLRYWNVETALSVSGGLLGTRKRSQREEWVDPLVGVKGLSPIGDSKFFVSGFGLIGGFGAGSDFMWDVNANLGYQWTGAIATTIGYRYLDVDYEDGGFVYDIAQDGPVLGLSWRF